MYESLVREDPPPALPPVLAAISAVLVEPRSLVGRPARELLDAAAACQMLATQVQVLEAELIAAMEADPTDESYIGPPAVQPDPELVTAHELALVLGVSTETARNRRYVADQVTADLPLVVGAAREGSLRWWQVRRTLEAVCGLDAAAIALVDERVAAAARAGRCRSRFSARLARAVLAAAPDLAEQRHAEGMSERTAWFRPAENGMTAFGGLLPAEEAVVVAACLTRLAYTPVATPPVSCDVGGRTIDQARADAFAGICGELLVQPLRPPARVDGESGAAASLPPPGRPERPDRPRSPDRTERPGQSAGSTTAAGSTRRAQLRAARRTRRRADRAADRLSAAIDRMRAAGLLSEAALAADAPSRLQGAPQRRGRRPTGEIRVTVSAETLLGTSQAPGELDGYGPITAGHARRLAHRAGTTWRRLLTDPTSGTILDLGRTHIGRPKPSPP